MKKILASVLLLAFFSLPACEQSKSEAKNCDYYTKLLYTNLGQPYRISNKNGGIYLKTLQKDSVWATFSSMDNSLNIFLDIKKICDTDSIKVYFVYDKVKMDITNSKKGCEETLVLYFAPKYDEDKIKALRKGKLDSIIVDYKKGAIKMPVQEKQHEHIKMILDCFYSNSKSDKIELDPIKE